MAALTKTVELVDGRTAVIKRLSWLQVKSAARKQLTESADQMKEFGAEMIKAFQSGSTPEDVAKKVKAVEDSRKTNPNSYDMGEILVCGIVSIDQADVFKPEIDELDADVADQLHTAIVAFAFERAGKNA